MPVAEGMIHVALDARTLNREHLRGIGRCVRELVERGSRHRLRWDLLADRPDLPFHYPAGVLASNSHLFECRGHRFQLWEQWALPRKARGIKAQLLHCPASSLPWWQPVPTVVTLHDTIPWQANEPGWARGWYTDGLIPRALRKCAAIITVSETSRNDILRLWPTLSEKVHVIPNGVDDSYLTVRSEPLGPNLVALGIRPPYFLYWGGTIPRKRLPWAIQVVAALEEPDVQLVLCGVERSAHDQIRAGLKPELRQRVCLAPFIDEADMPRLYQNALAVLYPTLYEGFGLPALESQACGTPVLFSALGSLAELQGPGSVVLPPDDLPAWVSACRALVAARRWSSTINEQARTWARQFSWDVCVERTVAVYRHVLAGQTPI